MQKLALEKKKKITIIIHVAVDLSRMRDADLSEISSSRFARAATRLPKYSAFVAFGRREKEINKFAVVVVVVGNEMRGNAPECVCDARVARRRTGPRKTAYVIARTSRGERDSRGGGGTRKGGKTRPDDGRGPMPNPPARLTTPSEG